MLKLDIRKFVNTFKFDAQIYLVCSLCLTFLGYLTATLEVSVYLAGVSTILAVTSLVLGLIMMFFHVMLLKSITEDIDFVESSSFLKGFKFGSCVIQNNRIIFYNTTTKKKLFSIKSSMIEHALCVSTY